MNCKPTPAEQLWTNNVQGMFEQNSGSIKGSEVIRKQQDLAKQLEGTQISKDIDAITNLVIDSINQSNIAKLDPEVGGQYSQKGMDINSDMLNFTIGETQKTTAARINHVFEHEKQHALQEHHKPLKLIQGTFIFGQEEFTPTEIIEAINMHNTGTHSSTGQQVVSLDYMKMNKKLEKALRISPYTISELTKALTKRDLTNLDDRFLSIQTFAA